MAKDKGGAPGQGNNVAAIGSAACCVEKCTKKVDKLNFCTEHYTWFKEGLVSKKGQRPTDFDKKYQAYLLRTKKAA
jgi:hypothetical protein